MHTTNLGFKLPLLFDLILSKMQTDIIMQQIQRNNDKPPAEPIAMNRIVLPFVLVSILDVSVGVMLASTRVVSFDRKETDVTVNTCPSTVMSEVFVVQFCNIVNSCDVVKLDIADSLALIFIVCSLSHCKVLSDT